MKVKKITPSGTKIITTANMYTEKDLEYVGGIIDASKIKKGINEYQKVISVGPRCSFVKVGDIVCIDPSRFAVKKFQENSLKADLMENTVTKYNFPVVNLDGKDYLMLDEYMDVTFRVDDYELDVDDIKDLS